MYNCIIYFKNRVCLCYYWHAGNIIFVWGTTYFKVEKGKHCILLYIKTQFLPPSSTEVIATVQCPSTKRPPSKETLPAAEVSGGRELTAV